MSRNIALNMVVGQLPRYIVESIAIGGILVLSIYFAFTSENLTSDTAGAILPNLGLYALAGYKLIPAIQGIIMQQPRYDLVRHQLSQSIQIYH